MPAKLVTPGEKGTNPAANARSWPTRGDEALGAGDGSAGERHRLCRNPGVFQMFLRAPKGIWKLQLLQKQMTRAGDATAPQEPGDTMTGG